jgi:RNA polymerase sigma-70 factor (ECF subfamily)
MECVERDIAFEKLYNEYYFRVFRYAWKKVRNSDDAEDLTQNAFIYCYQRYEEYDERRASFGTWIFLVLNSRIKNYFRDKKCNVHIDEIIEILPDETDFDHAIELEEMRIKLLNALKTCTLVQARIVQYRYFHKQSIRDISLCMGLSEANVRTQLSRAIKKMRAHLEKKEGDR